MTNRITGSDNHKDRKIEELYEMVVYDITDLEPAVILARLYNTAGAMGMGMVQYQSELMTEEVAKEILEWAKNEPSGKIDYVRGRQIKAYFEKDMERRDTLKIVHPYDNGPTWVEDAIKYAEKSPAERAKMAVPVQPTQKEIADLFLNHELPDMRKRSKGSGPENN